VSKLVNLRSDLLEQPIIETTGVLKFWVINALSLAESTGLVPLNDRIVSLILLSEIWRAKPKYIEKAVPNASVIITKILKRAARDMKRTLVIISIELMFRLLESFARDKLQSAPSLYKTLTFLLIDFYWEIDVREVMLKHFVDLYKNYESIPIMILLEPLLKQIEVSQYMDLNVFDF
jgi:hypothetical protein